MARVVPHRLSKQPLLLRLGRAMLEPLCRGHRGHESGWAELRRTAARGGGQKGPPGTTRPLTQGPKSERQKTPTMERTRPKHMPNPSKAVNSCKNVRSTTCSMIRSPRLCLFVNKQLSVCINNYPLTLTFGGVERAHRDAHAAADHGAT
jgi:hypothetical protein